MKNGVKEYKIFPETMRVAADFAETLREFERKDALARRKGLVVRGSLRAEREKSFE